MDRKIKMYKDRDYYRLKNIESYAKDTFGQQIRVGKDKSSFIFSQG